MKKYKIIEVPFEYDVEEYGNGFKRWYLNSQLHRENGPAIEGFNGYKGYYKHGKCHKEDGPAVIFSDGPTFYYLNGVHFLEITSDEEWLEFQKELIIKEIIE